MITDQKPIHSTFNAQSTADEVASGINLKGKIALVTGGHSGLGLETTRALVKAGAQVVVGARDLAKARRNLEGLKNVTVSALDLAEPASVDAFCDEVLKTHSRLNLLINNAGIMRTPTHLKNSRGHELQFATNHLGHFQLTAGLWPALKNAGDARVISLSSIAHRYCGVDLEDPDYKHRPYDKAAAYGQAKSANSLFAVELNRRGANHGVKAFAVHPGGIITDLVRDLTDEELKVWDIYRENGVLKAPPGRYKTPEQGAATSIWCALSPQLENDGGVYCEDCNIAQLVPNEDNRGSGVRTWAVDQAAAKGLWDLSESFTGTKWPN